MMLLPCNPVKLEPRGEGWLTADTQMEGKPIEFFIDPEVFRKVSILDIRVGNRSMVAAGGQLPGAIFTPFTEDSKDLAVKPLQLDIDNIRPGLYLAVWLRNLTDDPIEVVGGWHVLPPEKQRHARLPIEISAAADTQHGGITLFALASDHTMWLSHKYDKWQQVPSLPDFIPPGELKKTEEEKPDIMGFGPGGKYLGGKK